jgi:uncharacterized protein YqjF (DUF2071 family)
MVPYAEPLEVAARQARSLDVTEHRPWPLPERPWVLAETCRDQLFAHWRVSAAALREYLPEEVGVDEYDGSAWLGVTPFAVEGLRVRGLLPVPVVSSFLELNVRTYVTHGDRPGIWFLSLDASSRLAVEAARRLYRLRFFRATITVQRQAGRVVYVCARDDRHAFSGSYRPVGEPRPADPGSLEHFLTERYCLYTEDRGRLFRADIHHRPWLLQAVEAAIELNTMPPDWLSLEDEPLFLYSASQDVILWSLEEVTGKVT